MKCFSFFPLVLSTELLCRLFLSMSDSCPSSKAQSCHIVEGKVIVIIEGGDEAEDGAIVSKAYTVVRLAFPLHDQGTARVSYIGNDPLSLTSIEKLSKRADMGTSEHDMGVFATIFLAISICGSAAAIVSVIAFLRTCGNEKAEDGAVDDDDRSIGVPSTIDITLSASSDDIGELGGNVLPLHGGCSLDHAKHLIFAEEEQSALRSLGIIPSIAPSSVPSKFIVLSSSRLTQVPEETSVSTFECKEMSI